MSKDEINAFLGAGTSYQGKLNFQGSVRIDGTFIGEIQSDGTLIVGKDANVEGQVQVGQLILSGNVKGEIVAGKRVVLHKTANLQGGLNTPVLVIEEGAKIEGDVTMHAAKGGRKAGEEKPGEAKPAESPLGGDAPLAAGMSVLLGGAAAAKKI